MAEQKTEASKAEDKARRDAEAAQDAQRRADEAGKSKEQREAEAAAQRADDSRAAAEQASAEERTEASAEPTLAKHTKSVSAAVSGDTELGEHTVQTFANTPENPQPAPGLDPDLPREKKVRMEITDSDHPDPNRPKVTYVDPVMVGDYLRAGWRKAA